MVKNVQDEIDKRFQLQKEYLGVNKPINHLKPLVSVMTITYQHINFIEDCIKGVLMQQTNFPIEFIIGEDGSIDGTREICIRYANDFPDKIRLFNRDREISQLFDDQGKLIRRLNGTFNLMSARGKYIAICEGDDFWTDPLKLQKQVDFLEENPEYGLVHTNYQRVKVINGEKLGIRWDKSFDRRKLHGNILNHLLLQESSVWTGTVCFRSTFIKNPPYSSEVYKSGDFILWSYIAAQSKIAFLDEVTAVHNLLEHSAIHGITYHQQIEFYKSDFRVVKFIVKQFNLSDEIEQKAKIKYLLRVLGRAFSKKDKKLFYENYQIYKDTNSNEKPELMLYYYALKYELLYYPIRILLKFQKIFKLNKGIN